MKKIIFKFFVIISFFSIYNLTFNIENCFSQWQPDVRLTNDSAGSWTSGNKKCVAANGTFLHVVWYDWRGGNSQIYYKRSTDGGITWSADTRLTTNAFQPYDPSIIVTGSVVHIVWHDQRGGNYEIYYKRSSDDGISWSADIRLTYNNYPSFDPSFEVVGSNVHVVWNDYRDGNHEIYYKRSTDSGINWGADTRLTYDTAYSGSTSVTVSGSVVYIVWEDYRDGNSEIYYKRSTDAGVSWGEDTRLTNNTAWSWHPSVAVFGLVVHVVWYDKRDGNFEIYYKRSTDAGISWGEDTRLTNDTAYSGFPSVAVSGSVVHNVWYDERDGNREIYYKRSTDAGVTWGADTRLTNNSSESWGPSIAVFGTVVNVVWCDKRDGNWEIYYKRDPTGNPIEIKNISSEIPSSYSLEQNYPNPFNPSTKINFDIPAKTVGQTFLSVYDILGKEVATLVNEQLAPGTYSVDWDASAFTSGVYFYRLSTGDFSNTKRMLLIK